MIPEKNAWVTKILNFIIIYEPRGRHEILPNHSGVRMCECVCVSAALSQSRRIALSDH